MTPEEAKTNHAEAWSFLASIGAPVVLRERADLEVAFPDLCEVIAAFLDATPSTTPEPDDQPPVRVRGAGLGGAGILGANLSGLLGEMFRPPTEEEKLELDTSLISNRLRELEVLRNSWQEVLNRLPTMPSELREAIRVIARLS